MRHAREHRRAFEAVRCGTVGPRQHVRTDRRILIRGQAVIRDVDDGGHGHADHLGGVVARIIGNGHGEAIGPIEIRIRGIAPEARRRIDARCPVRRRSRHGEHRAVGKPVHIRCR